MPYACVQASLFKGGTTRKDIPQESKDSWGIKGKRKIKRVKNNINNINININKS